MINRKVVIDDAPRSREASSSAAGIRSSRGTIVRIANGIAITTCPIAAVYGESGTPIALNRISSEIASTISGITKGASSSPDMSPLAKNRRRTKAIDAGIASAVATIAVIVATCRLVFSASRIAGLARNS